MHNALIQWILIGSVVLIGIVGAISFIFIKIKVKKMRKEYSDELDKAESIIKQTKNLSPNKTISSKDIEKAKKQRDGQENALSRNTLGELLWDFDADLINKKIPHLAFVDMEFLISTIYRNQYKSFLHTNSTCGYELITLASKTKVTLHYNIIQDKKIMNQYASKYKILPSKIKKATATNKFDIVLIPKFDKEIIDVVVTSYKKLINGGMIFIAGLQNRKQKKFINDLKKYLKLVNYKFEESMSSKNILLIVK